MKTRSFLRSAGQEATTASRSSFLVVTMIGPGGPWIGWLRLMTVSLPTLIWARASPTRPAPMIVNGTIPMVAEADTTSWRLVKCVLEVGVDCFRKQLIVLLLIVGLFKRDCISGGNICALVVVCYDLMILLQDYTFKNARQISALA